MKRSYYSAPIREFLDESEHEILGKLAFAHSFALEDLQKNAWLWQIRFLKSCLCAVGHGYILFEYSIPRMGKRVDSIIILGGIAFIIEFKVGESQYNHNNIDQVLDYALDLKNFHSASHQATLIPILVSSDAPDVIDEILIYDDKVSFPLRVNSKTFIQTLVDLVNISTEEHIDPIAWERSEYRPTPTIIEAAQALYRGHGVEEISRSDAANLNATTQAIGEVIKAAKDNGLKAICFVTGVPGAGKTLAGLNLACENHNIIDSEHAVFLSGNGPLVEVLQKALARHHHSQNSGTTRKSEAISKAKAFIQNIHHFRDNALIDENAPVDRVVIFDEAQRAWTQKQTTSFMAQKKGFAQFNKSEPEFLIEIMDRHQSWAVIICLIGGGQEINTGEAGLPEWFHALGTRFNHWDVFVSDRLTEYEYNWGTDLYGSIARCKLTTDSRLHLATSLRSFRSEQLATYVKLLLDVSGDEINEVKLQLDGKYPIVLTRNIETAKTWVRSKARGTERYGLIASSGAHRLRPFGVTIKTKVDPSNWFLNDASDVRSSYYLEEVATEFDIQGLELDWTVVAWDADLRYNGVAWEYMAFRGTEWQRIHDTIRQLYLKNAYRVLLTRARQGMVIFIPEGDNADRTRLSKYYDGTYHYLRDCGIDEIT